jgi:hypothetical protein
VDAVLPLRLGTVVADDESAAELLHRHGEALRAELDRIEGHAEWTVTVRALDPQPDVDTEAPAPASSGTDYLDHRRTQLRARESRRDGRARLAGSIHDRLAATAADADVVTSRPMEEGPPPLLHGVYLVERTRLPRLEEEVEELRAAHPDALIELSGPWPPYHFTSVRLGAESEGGHP